MSRRAAIWHLPPKPEVQPISAGSDREATRQHRGCGKEQQYASGRVDHLGL